MAIKKRKQITHSIHSRMRNAHISSLIWTVNSEHTSISSTRNKSFEFELLVPPIYFIVYPNRGCVVFASSLISITITMILSYFPLSLSLPLYSFSESILWIGDVLISFYFFVCSVVCLLAQCLVYVYLFVFVFGRAHTSLESRTSWKREKNFTYQTLFEFNCFSLAWALHRFRCSLRDIFIYRSSRVCEFQWTFAFFINTLLCNCFYWKSFYLLFFWIKL